MKNHLLVLFIFFLLSAVFPQAQGQETQPEAKRKLSENAIINVVWEGTNSVFITIDGNTYTFKGGQSQMLSLRSNVLLEFNVQVPGTKYDSEGIMFDSTGGELRIWLKEEKVSFSYKNQEEIRIREQKQMQKEEYDKQKEIDVKKNFLQIIETSMVFVEGGTFMMGCTTEQGNECGDDERPAHSVTISDFYISKYELTQELWEAVMGNNPSKFSGCGECPVEFVNWNDVQDFILKLNSMSGKNYRLPTEAEWEYASRGGKKSNGFKYSGSDTLEEVGWYKEISGDQTHPVGQRFSNELGIYDMSGNVYEWCEDWYGGYQSSAQINPKGPPSGRMRTMRGGSFGYGARSSTMVFGRGGLIPENGSHIVGFRLAQ